MSTSQSMTEVARRAHSSRDDIVARRSPSLYQLLDASRITLAWFCSLVGIDPVFLESTILI